MTTPLKTEFEAKFLDIRNKDLIREKLQLLQAVQKYPERIFRMRIFDHLANLNMAVDYIRIRDEGDIITLSAKVHAKKGGELSDQKEEVIEVSDYETAVQILTLAGLVQSDNSEKKRELWILDGAEVCIDTWPGEEPYIEIESKDEDHVKSIATQLGLDWDKKCITSVVEILMDKYGWDKEKTLQHFSNLQF